MYINRTKTKQNHDGSSFKVMNVEELCTHRLSLSLYSGESRGYSHRSIRPMNMIFFYHTPVRDAAYFLVLKFCKRILIFRDIPLLLEKRQNYAVFSTITSF